MLRNIIFFTLLLNSCLLFSQSISYSVGYGLSRSPNHDIQSSVIEKYRKGQEFSVSLGLNGTKTIADHFEIRLSTYESTLQNEMRGIIGLTGVNMSIRKYILEIQGYYLKYDMKKFGSINLGSKLSFLMRSDVSGYTFITFGNDSEIKSIDYIREGTLYASVLAKYSPGSIRLNNNHKLKPSYTFSYSFNRDMNTIVTNSRLINHIFELSFISKLSTR